MNSKFRLRALVLMMMVGMGAAQAAPNGGTATEQLAPRTARRFVVRADAGWNSLAGLGIRGSWMTTPHLALDLGAGYVISGPKAGARLRWNFSTGDLTPYVAMGAVVSGGRSGPQTIKSDNGDEFSFHVGRAAYAQGVAGLDYQDADRISYSLEIGWAQALNHRDLHVISGMPSDNDWREVRWAAGAGLVVGAAVGYAF